MSNIDDLINQMKPQRDPDDIDISKKASQPKEEKKFKSTIKEVEIDYYKILGVLPTATQLEIKRAYQSKLKKLHPDKTTQTKENIAKYKLLREAGDLLCDQYERKAYDMQKKMDDSYKSHKSQKDDYKEYLKLQDQNMTEDDRKISKLNFERGLSEMDLKHGYNKKDETSISKDEYDRIVGDREFLREQEEIELTRDDIFKDKKPSMTEFNKLFEQKKRRDDKRKKRGNTDLAKVTDNIMAFNDYEDGSGGANLNSYENLYAEDKYEGYNEKYSGVGSGLIGNDDGKSEDDISIDTPNENDYDNHNKNNSKESFDSAFKKMMADRETDADKLMNMDQSEFGSALDDKFGISNHFGFMVGTDRHGHQRNIGKKINVEEETRKAYKKLTKN
jgi:curved DNA-binding protein CbpA